MHNLHVAHGRRVGSESAARMGVLQLDATCRLLRANLGNLRVQRSVENIGWRYTEEGRRGSRQARKLTFSPICGNRLARCPGLL